MINNDFICRIVKQIVVSYLIPHLGLTFYYFNVFNPIISGPAQFMGRLGFGADVHIGVNMTKVESAHTNLCMCDMVTDCLFSYRVVNHRLLLPL